MYDVPTWWMDTVLAESLWASFYKVPPKETVRGVVSSGGNSLIPTIRADFPCFGLKIVELSCYLPAPLASYLQAAFSKYPPGGIH